MNKIEIIIKNIQKYLILDKETFFENCISERLNKSLKQYYNSLLESFDKLNEYNEEYNLRLAKKINKR